MLLCNMQASDRFGEAIRRFDAENARDPNMELVDGVERPRELVYAERLSSWVSRLAPEASEALCLAARCQHLCRWLIPRESYPMNRTGYLRWRQTLKQLHAEKSATILQELGYSDELIARVRALNLKEHFPNDPESRILEDALCLVFLEWQFAELANKTTEEKMVQILQKTWKKMTPAGRAAALTLPYSDRERALLNRATSEPHKDATH